MKFSIRKSGAVLVGLALATAFAAGASAQELRFSWWGGGERHEAMLKAARLFEAKNPGVKIKAEYSGFQGYQERLSTQIAGRNEPDVMQVNWAWLSAFSKNGEGFYDLRKAGAAVKTSEFSEHDLALCALEIRCFLRAPGLDTLFGGIAFIRSRPVVLGAISLDLFAVLLGVAIALPFARRRFFGRDTLDAILTLPMVMPHAHAHRTGVCHQAGEAELAAAPAVSVVVDRLQLGAHTRSRVQEAIEAPRFSSSNRSPLRARLIEPFCLNPVACPVSASSECRSSEVYLASSVMRRVARSCPISPAACHVVPQVSLPCSSRSTSRLPSLAR